MDAFELHEARYVQELADAGNVGGLTVGNGAYATPNGKVRTVICAKLFPSVAETRQFWIGKVSRVGTLFAVTVPFSVALSATICLPVLTEGTELKLYPGEYLQGQRDVATAGSTLGMVFQFIETDLPYYAYEEPLNKVVKTKQAHGSVYRRSGAISTGSGPGVGGGEGGRGGRAGGGEPI